MKNNAINERKPKTSVFFVVSYALAALVLLAQGFLMVWLEFV